MKQFNDVMLWKCGNTTKTIWPLLKYKEELSTKRATKGFETS
jgi:hypothetical protein